MNRPIVLLVDDNIDILEANRRILTKAGYEIETAVTLAAARRCLKERPPNVIVLDVMLPDGSGIDFIGEIRQYTVAPILLLTAMAEKDQRIGGLRAGGDDYITKPYDVDELRERVAAFLRRDTMVRNDQPMQSKLLCGELTLDLGKSEAFIGETALLLSQKEFTLLLLLAQSEGITQKSEELYEKVWSRPMLEDSGALKTAVSRLRKKLVDADLDIVTVRGEGYLFERQ